MLLTDCNYGLRCNYYQGNNSVRYDEKEFLERRSKLRRLKGAQRNLRVGEEVTIKTKNCLWKAIVRTRILKHHKGEGKEKEKAQHRQMSHISSTTVISHLLPLVSLIQQLTV